MRAYRIHTTFTCGSLAVQVCHPFGLTLLTTSVMFGGRVYVPMCRGRAFVPLIPTRRGLCASGCIVDGAANSKPYWTLHTPPWRLSTHSMTFTPYREC